MTITFTNGTITTTASEQTISEVTANEHFAHWLHTHNMTASETFRVRVYVRDSNASSDRVYLDENISGVQTKPSYYIPFIAATKYKLTIQRTAGSDKAVTWERVEVS